MKKSELATVIREEFLALLKEEGTVTTDDSAEAEKLAKKGVDVNLTKEEMDDDEMDKAAAKGVAAQATAALKAQQKKKALKAFMDKMKDAGIVSDSNKVLDARKYKDEFAKFKASL